MNKKAQLDFGDFEINWFAAGLAVLAGIMAFWITGNPLGGVTGTQVKAAISPLWRIGSLVLTIAISYFFFAWKFQD